MGASYADFSRLLWIPSLLLLLGLTGTFAYLRGSIRRLGAIGLVLAAIGFGLDMLGNLIEFWVFGVLLVPFVGEFRTGSAGSQLGYEIASYGTMFLMVGLLVFGVACLRARLPLRWRVLPFLVGCIYATILLFFFTETLVVHGLLYGLSWVLLGSVLRRDTFHQSFDA